MTASVMYCKDCGEAMTKLTTDSSWHARYRCSNCGLGLEVTYGDAMGGSSDAYYYTHKPFVETRKKKEDQ